ncbi:MAG TPA: transcriptional regulator [Bradyrhizobium sp.]|uniref:transcriptional regulator n=1 Tax=Bradyrhizobium sp. TaxID=376 RepID=UPI002D7E3FE1|nr:transcriptional regulator [Bradyrhizobium sp.]HET7889238.1 transcriptional regulator [Bradyrhizobium sp.]
MSQQLPTWRTSGGQANWLSRLIEAMEACSRPEWRARPVDPRELRALQARLAQPAKLHPAYGSRFSLRN